MSVLPLRIRNFQNEDLETLYEIDRVCFAEDIAFSRTELLCQIHNCKSITRVGEGLGRILGFVIARIENPSYAHVLTLDVVPGARRCGIGIALMRTMHRVLAKKKIRAAFLEVSEQNLPAQRLYEKLQYRYVETVHGYYRGREDAYRMVRTRSLPSSR
jgi:[ribosomal protein S18]-alanine N-acetyltransferase